MHYKFVLTPQAFWLSRWTPEVEYARQEHSVSHDGRRISRSSWVSEAIQRAKPQIEALMASSQSGMGRKTVANSIRALLISEKLASRVSVPVLSVAVHPDNRFGTGLDVTDVHPLLELICTNG